MRISVIIPTLDESENVAAAIRTARQADDVEVIVCDGGSSDSTAGIARSCGANTLCTGRGRAGQMNAGAEAATGDVLLFLHADTKLPKNYGLLIMEALKDTDIVAGAFTLSISSPLKSLRIIEWLADFRSRRMSMPYGDQAIFLRASTFRELGGFADMPIMEDFELMRRVKKYGRIVILPGKAITSARRWIRNGVLRTTVINQLVILGYMAGIDPRSLRRLYG
jgi:rSAM/selenodomain-associated transferase 2